MTHYKGKYRLRTPIDEKTKMFPREYTGQFSENDVYIDCYKGGQIFHIGGKILEFYCPSLQRGRNIVKAIIGVENTHTTYSGNENGATQHIDRNDENLPIKHAFQGEDIIFNIVETDSEVTFRFNAPDIEKLEPYLQPKTNGADRSPFSTKNLPKVKYIIPNEDLAIYKSVIENIPKNQLVGIVHITNSFFQSIATRKNTLDMIKADMALKGLRGKEYIHSTGLWDKYIKYLKTQLEQKG